MISKAPDNESKLFGDDLKTEVEEAETMNKLTNKMSKEPKKRLLVPPLLQQHKGKRQLPKSILQSVQSVQRQERQHIWRVQETPRIQGERLPPRPWQAQGARNTEILGVRLLPDRNWCKFKEDTLKLANEAINNFEGGRLQQFSKYWEKMTDDWQKLDWIAGVKLKFRETPEQLVEPEPYHLNSEKQNILDEKKSRNI